ncbi:hypothetical protein B0J12DRAFT_676655 [Macrophomina phaseolina]|uniref:Uncharacterized protein n=1 Tax=Macrophomina phaseolina TaxID=35725 RepID=A0ABQ8G2C6_9PEZI|nr:hypothetical protein B0J12DRAFT_676655 [Macrophomina phaseolina]
MPDLCVGDLPARQHWRRRGYGCSLACIGGAGSRAGLGAHSYAAACPVADAPAGGRYSTARRRGPVPWSQEELAREMIVPVSWTAGASQQHQAVGFTGDASDGLLALRCLLLLPLTLEEGTVEPIKGRRVDSPSSMGALLAYLALASVLSMREHTTAEHGEKRVAILFARACLDLSLSVSICLTLHLCAIVGPWCLKQSECARLVFASS